MLYTSASSARFHRNRVDTVSAARNGEQAQPEDAGEDHGECSKSEKENEKVDSRRLEQAKDSKVPT